MLPDGAFAAGVLLGAILRDGLSWRWVMFVNVPIGIAAVALSPVLLSESRKQTATAQIDLADAVTVIAGLVLLVYALVQAPEARWVGASTVLLLGGAAALLALFVWVESRSPAPLVAVATARTQAIIASTGKTVARQTATTGLYYFTKILIHYRFLSRRGTAVPCPYLGY